MAKKIIIGMLIIIVTAVLQAEMRVIPMPDLQKPVTVSLDKTQMYVTEDIFIYIYSLKDFKLVKKFGKKGEGPQEFNLNPQIGPLIINVQTNDIFAHSFGKVSWFAKDGTFKKEQKLPNPIVLFLQPFGKNFVGMGFDQENQKAMRKLYIYDGSFAKIKELHKVDHNFQRGKGLNVLENPPLSVSFDNKLFVAWENDFIIDVVDLDGNKLYTIKQDIDRRPVTENDKKEVIEFLKTSPATRDYFELIKPINFPSNFPALQNIFVTGDKIYLLTFKKEGKQNELLILDIKGKLLKKMFIDFIMDTPLLPYPYTIEEGTFYQIIENEDEEGWELHKTEIK
ncbi:MAG: hypothetical protein MUF15_12980 [Acidobacteria bacterium]|nr:hypothetical protein [Acidobacteriota bacterium]